MAFAVTPDRTPARLAQGNSYALRPLREPGRDIRQLFAGDLVPDRVAPLAKPRTAFLRKYPLGAGDARGRDDLIERAVSVEDRLTGQPARRNLYAGIERKRTA